MRNSNHQPIIGATSESANFNHYLLRRIIERCRHEKEKAERVLALYRSPEVLITHQRSNDRITHVRCWYYKNGQRTTDLFPAWVVIAVWAAGQRHILTCGLEWKNEQWSFRRKYPAKVAVRFKTSVAHLTTEPDPPRAYNNLKNLADCDPEKPDDIQPTYPHQWPDTSR